MRGPTPDAASIARRRRRRRCRLHYPERQQPPVMAGYVLLGTSCKCLSQNHSSSRTLPPLPPPPPLSLSSLVRDHGLVSVRDACTWFFVVHAARSSKRRNKNKKNGASRCCLENHGLLKIDRERDFVDNGSGAGVFLFFFFFSVGRLFAAWRSTGRVNSCGSGECVGSCAPERTVSCSFGEQEGQSTQLLWQRSCFLQCARGVGG